VVIFFTCFGTRRYEAKKISAIYMATKNEDDEDDNQENHPLVRCPLS
jgi:hypothetical protein